MANKKPFTITEEMVEKATKYIPLAEKMAWAAVMAKECVEPVEMDVLNIQANETMALTSLYQENTHVKHLYLMQAFLSNYMHIDGVPENFTSEDYDEYAQYQPINQLERMKSTCKAETRNDIFDLLSDYKALEKYLNNEIHKVVSARNDTPSRILASITLMCDPETVKKMTAELQKTIGDVEVAQKKLTEKRAKATAEEKKHTANTATPKTEAQ